MNYYEELGIRSDADEEEIRKAHRRLVKLMHPDQHRDQGLKQLAETQMRRLNSIVAVLLDPDERAEYDEQLRTGNLGGDMANPAQQQRSWRSVPWWIASTLGTIILTVGTIWLVADRYGHPPNQPRTVEVKPDPEPPVTPPEKHDLPAPTTRTDAENSTVVSVPTDTKPPVAVNPPPPTRVPEPPKIEVKKFDPPKIEEKRPEPPKVEAKKIDLPKIENKKQDAVPKVLSASSQSSSTGKNPLSASRPAQPALTAKQPASQQHMDAAQTTLPSDPKKRLAYVPPTPPIQPVRTDTRIAGSAPILNTSMVSPGPDIPVTIGKIPSPPARHPLEGEWVYAPSTPQQKKAGFFPPEFIHLMLIKDTTGGIRGEYSARYNVDRSVSPDVNFSLRATDQSAMKFVWTAANGAHGTLTIDTVESDVMRIEWRDTSKAHGDRLTSGVATLVRKN